jgi:uncharacterized protein YcbK (DUF882 family)
MRKTVEAAASRLASPPSALIGRRAALTAALGCAATLATPVPVWARALAHKPGRNLSLLNLHTGERLNAEYWHNGRYVADALHAVSVLLRDHCNNQVHPIDPELLDLIHVLHGRVRSRAPFSVVCGYRSPETNAMMHEASAGVAAHSLHMQGKAIDIRLPGTRLGAIRKTALALRLGGVGFYPEDDFVHIDTGPIRLWTG